jgi:hypothetical protein
MCGTPSRRRGMLIGDGKQNRERTQAELDAAYKSGARISRGEEVPWAITSEGRKANQGGGQGALAGGGANPSVLGGATAADSGTSAITARRKQLTSDMGRFGSAMPAGQNSLLGG